VEPGPRPENRGKNEAWSGLLRVGDCKKSKGTKEGEQTSPLVRKAKRTPVRTLKQLEKSRSSLKSEWSLSKDSKKRPVPKEKRGERISIQIITATHAGSKPYT